MKPRITPSGGPSLAGVPAPVHPGRFLAGIVVALLLCSPLISGLLSPGVAAASGGSQPIARLALQDPGGSPEPAATPPPASPQDVPLLTLGYPDRTVRSGIASIPIEIPLRPGQTIDASSAVTIRYNASPLLDFANSSLSVAVNGVARESTGLAAGNGEIGELVVPLEATDRLPQTASVVLTLDIRLTMPGVSCPPAIDPSRWLTIRSDSSVRLGATTIDQSAGLADLAGMFFPATPDPVSRAEPATPLPITIVVGQGAEPAEMQAAGYVATAIGRWAAERQVQTSILFSDQIPADQPTIVVSSGLRFAGSLAWGDVNWDGVSYRTPTGVIPADRGFLALQRTAVPRILISSATPVGVLDAASALVQPGRAAQLAGSWAVLTGRDPLTPDLRQPTWDADTATFAELSAGTYTLSGTGEQQIGLTFPRPASWLLSGGSHLILDVAVAGNISPDASLSVTLNGSWMGSMPLRAGGTDPVVTGPSDVAVTNQSARLDIPADQLGAVISGASRREMRLDMTASLGAGATCVGLTPPSVTILPTSRWVLPHDVEGVFELASYPAPFAGNPQQSVQPLIVVVPDWPTTGEMQAAMRTMASMARWSAGDDRLLPVFATYGRLTAEDRTAANLVAIGTAYRNPLVGDMVNRNAGMFAQPSLTDGTSTIPPVLGQIALLPSPWKSEGAILVLTSPIDAGVPQAGAAFEDTNRLALLAGGMVVVSGTSDTQTLQAARPPVAIDSGVVARFGWDRWITFWLIAAVIVLLAVGAWAIGDPRSGRRRDPSGS